MSGGPSLPNKPHLDLKPDVCQSSRKLSGGASTSTTTQGRREAMGDVILDVSLSSSVVQCVPFLPPWIGGEALLPIGFCLIW